MERSKRTKSEQEYVRALISGLSLQRLTDQEIVDYLREEKQITIGRSTVTITRNRMEREAGNWYVELRKSAYKYVAAYKQRIDSLLSYQKRLHEIISNTKKDEVKIRAISELHSIEMDIFNLWKQLPNLEVSEPEHEIKQERESEPMTFDKWASKNHLPRVMEDSSYSDEENGKYYWDLHKRYQEYVKDWEFHMFGPDNKNDINAEWTVESEAWVVDDNERKRATATSNTGLSTVLAETETETITSEAAPIVETDVPTEQDGPQSKSKDTIDLDIAGRFPKPVDYQFSWVQCNFVRGCQKWFKTEELRSKHVVKYHT